MILSQIRKSVRQIVAGSNITITPNAGTGSVTISSGGSVNELDTLATVTSRGRTTSAALTFTNNTNSTNITTGALVVDGGVGVGQDLHVGGDVFSFNFATSSDERLKDNIREIENPLELVLSLDGKRFNFKETPEKEAIGFIAQQIETIIPEAVSTKIDDFKTVSYDMIIPILVEAIKVLSTKVSILENNHVG